jgi:hypothetical protein
MLLILFAPCLTVFAKSKKCERAFDELGAVLRSRPEICPKKFYKRPEIIHLCFFLRSFIVVNYKL